MSAGAHGTTRPKTETLRVAYPPSAERASTGSTTVIVVPPGCEDGALTLPACSLVLDRDDRPFAMHLEPQEPFVEADVTVTVLAGSPWVMAFDTRLPSSWARRSASAMQVP